MTRKLNNIQRTAALTWSPNKSLLATGTIAGAMDDTFSNASELEIFTLDLNPESKSLEPSYKVSTNSRFNTLAWGHSTSEKPYGIIAGGMESGELELWDASAIIENKSIPEALMFRNSKHTGTLRGIDFNYFQTNLLASAGPHSEVYIWDLNQPSTPYTPGAKSLKMDDITSVAWNCQVPHIVSTASTNGYTVVWDLRNKKEIMTLGQNALTSGKGSISAIAWHPDVATQILTASNDNQNPIISLWDLRHAHSPEKVLAGHTKGVLGISWCRQDSDLFLSSGKDCRTLCWNPNTGELNGELSINHNWTFDVDWCPRNPDLLATSSFDGSVNVFSIQGLSSNEQQTAISDYPFDVALATAAVPEKSFELKNAPKWLRRPASASFGFGGKLVMFNSKTKAIVRINTIETDPEIVKRSEQLESAATENNVESLIEDRIEHAGQDKQDWEVLRTLFSENAREELISYLGFEREQVMQAANALLQENSKIKDNIAEKAVTDESASVSTIFREASANEHDYFPAQKDELIFTALKNTKPFNLYPEGGSETDHLITKAIVLGDFDSAVNVCLASERYSDALMLAMCGGNELLARTQMAYFAAQSEKYTYLRLLQGIVEEDLLSIARDADIKEWASILVVLCTFAQSKDFGPLCELLGDRLLQEHQPHATLFYLACGNMVRVSEIWIDQLEKGSMTSLQEFVEKVTIFRKAIEFEDSHDRREGEEGDFVLAHLYDKYCEYAEFMATQGKLEVALKYIDLIPPGYTAKKDSSSHRRESVVRDRVFHASKAAAKNGQQPSFPFEEKLLSNPNQLQQKQTVTTNLYAPQQQPSSPNDQPTGYSQYSPTAPIAINYGQHVYPKAQSPQQQQYGQVPAQYAPAQYQRSDSPTAPPPPPKGGAWNDPPIMQQQQREPPSATRRVTRPLSPSDAANIPPAALMRGLNGPPQPPPSSNTTTGVFYSAYQQPHQFLQQTQTPSPPPPPPMNAVAPAPMSRGASQQQQQRRSK